MHVVIRPAQKSHSTSVRLLTHYLPAMLLSAETSSLVSELMVILIFVTSVTHLVILGKNFCIFRNSLYMRLCEEIVSEYFLFPCACEQWHTLSATWAFLLRHSTYVQTPFRVILTQQHPQMYTGTIVGTQVHTYTFSSSLPVSCSATPVSSAPVAPVSNAVRAL